MVESSTVDRSFSWLGRFPLAVDVADTVRMVESRQVELLSNEADLARWIQAEVARFPIARAARGQLAAFREARHVVRALLFAHAEGQPLPRAEISAINRASALSPNFLALTGDGKAGLTELSEVPFDLFRAAVARSTVELISGLGQDALSVCHAPSCGMLFVRQHHAQRWCSSACGNRARVARHAARTAGREVVT
jgi:predicted RNA-binding Zn ribbon-like protein